MYLSSTSCGSARLMGTKNQPGAFDCYAAADPDEPMFILLARDPDAPQLLRLWADLRAQRGEDDAKVADARSTATTMERWRSANRPRSCRPCGECKDNMAVDGVYDAHHFVDGSRSLAGEYECKHCPVTTPACISCGEAVPFGKASLQCEDCEGQ